MHPGTRRPWLMTQRHLITCATLIKLSGAKQVAQGHFFFFFFCILLTSCLTSSLTQSEHLLTAHNKNTVSCVTPTFHQPNVQSTDCCSAYLLATALWVNDTRADPRWQPARSSACIHQSYRSSWSSGQRHTLSALRRILYRVIVYGYYCFIIVLFYSC